MLTQLEGFLVNSTVGVFGLVDVADKVIGLEQTQEDFGQTLATWGVGDGFYIVLANCLDHLIYEILPAWF